MLKSTSYRLRSFLQLCPMPFTLLPVIDTMIELYKQPRSIERFRQYLAALEGEQKGTLSLPIQGFNPMAKEHVLPKLLELKELGAETIAAQCLTQLELADTTIHVSLNLSDDVAGGWTNRYTSDYQSKFRFHGLHNKGFCIPIFWVSEFFSEAMILERVQEYAYRTLYWMDRPKPKTLQEHMEQEVFVAQKLHKPLPKTDLSTLQDFYGKHRNSSEEPLLLHFFYGDEAARSLGYEPSVSAPAFAGFRLAEQLAQIQNCQL